MRFLIDSPEIKVEGDGEWNARKHGGPRRRIRRKIHLGTDERTLEVWAIEITCSHIGVAPVLPDLVSQLPAEEEIASVTAHEAEDTRKYHDAIADRSAHAFIQLRKNAKPWKAISAGEGARNEALRTSNILAVRSRETAAVPPPKPRRDENALYETAGPAPHGAEL